MKCFYKLLLITILLIVAQIATAQDVIVKKDNTTVVAKVLEIGSTEVKFKKWSNQDGPLYTINVSEIAQINYQNGEVEKFLNNVPAPQETIELTNEEVNEDDNYNAVSEQYVKSEPLREPEPDIRHSRARVQFSLYGGMALPLGNFGTTSSTEWSAPLCLGNDVNYVSEGYGAAKSGINLGMKLHIPVFRDKNRRNIIGIVLQANYLRNGLSDKEKSDYRKYLSDMSKELNSYYNTLAYNYKVTQFPVYSNISFMTGVDYTFYVAKPFAIFGEFTWGLNLAEISELNVRNSYGDTYVYTANYTNYYSDTEMKVTYNSKVNLVYEFGAGIFLVNHISLGVYYTHFTPFTVSAKMVDKGSYGRETEYYSSKSLKITALSFRLGIHF